MSEEIRYMHRYKGCMETESVLGDSWLKLIYASPLGRLPLWLAPRQEVVASIVSDADEFVHEAVAALRAAGIRAEVVAPQTCDCQRTPLCFCGLPAASLARVSC